MRAKHYLNTVTSQFDLQIYPKTLADNLDDGTPPMTRKSSRPSGPHYTGGHIPGAINIPYQKAANLDNLTKFVKPGTPVAYCYTGHTGSLAAMALGILGYNVKNLLYGINGWSTTVPGIPASSTPTI